MLSKFSVKKPYTVVVAIVIALILGVVSYLNMSVELIPSVNLPYALVTTTYPGASPEQVEQAVTAPVEQAMSSLSGISSVSSVSAENYSMVILQFHDNVNMDSAIIEIRENLDMVSSYFTDEVGPSTILKLNPDMLPIVTASVSVKGLDDRQSASFIEEKLVPALKSADGVASVSASGLPESMVDVRISQDKLDKVNAAIRSAALKQAEEQLAQQIPGGVVPDKMLAQLENSLTVPEVSITADMVSAILQGQSFSMPAGSAAGDDGQSYLVRVGDKIDTVDGLKNLRVLSVPGVGDYTLKDVCDITVYDNSDTLYSKVNGNYAAMISLQKQPDFSTADVSHAVMDKFSELESKYEGVHFNMLMDQGEYVDMMISSILQNLLLGALFAVVILLIFLKRIKPTMIVAASIFISVIGAFVLMYFSGITLNMISMGGLALGVGMLVDNSIVVIENIFRMRSEGMAAKDAAISGAKEVAGAITASTLTTIIVFVPIVFTEGLTRQLFTDMALTIAFSLLASLVVALTLVPAAASATLKKHTGTKPGLIGKMNEAYVRLLDKSLNHKWVAISLVTLLLAGSAVLALQSGTELFPPMDSGSITVSVALPDDYTDAERFAAYDSLYERISGIDTVETVGIMDTASSMMGMMSSSSGSTIYVLLKEDRTETTSQIIDSIRDVTADLPYEITASNSNMDMSMLSGGSVVVRVYGTELDDLREAALLVAAAVSETQGTVEVDDGLGKDSEEIRITVDKDKAIDNGLTTAQVYLAVSDALKSPSAALTLTEGGVDYRVYVKDAATSSVTEAELANLTVKATDGSFIRVGDVAEITKAAGFSSIRRLGQERTLNVTASLKNGYDAGSVGNSLQEKLDALELPEGCRVEIGGESESIKTTFKDLYLMLGLAVAFIYLVMVAQFQSLLSPFIVMFTIPLAFTGGFFALALCGMPVSVVSLIGFIVLVGVVVNNGIVFVDYANQQMEKGMDKRQALLLTAKNRLRPILMTALTTIIALLAMAFDQSSGAEMLRPMAVTTIGGLTYSTLLTLFIVPCMYELFKWNRKKIDKEEE